jgi:hypothetical protein
MAAFFLYIKQLFNKSNFLTFQISRKLPIVLSVIVRKRCSEEVMQIDEHA